MYWSLGCLQAGNALLHVATYYYESPPYQSYIKDFSKILQSTLPKDYYNKGHLPWHIVSLQAVLEYFYTAYFLENHPESKKIVQFIEPEEGLFAGLEECFTDFSNMETKMATIIEDDFKIPFAEEFLELAKENAKLNLMKNGLVDESGKLLACMQKYKV